MSGGGAPDTTFSLKRVQEMLGVSRAVVTGLVAAGFVAPERGSRNEQRFSFQDLMLLRTAHSLQQARIAPRKILLALQKLKASLPTEMPLTGLRISAVGADIVVRDRNGPRSVATGQLLMDFEVATVGGAVAFMPPAAAAAAGPGPAEQWFRRGEEAEGIDPPAAEAAYRQAVSLAPAHVHASLNLGALLCEAGRCDEAVVVFEASLRHGATDALLHFNHAIALEDLKRLDEALGSYRSALALDPSLADAHYNAGRLLETLDDRQGALRHFAAYRRLLRHDRS